MHQNNEATNGRSTSWTQSLHDMAGRQHGVVERRQAAGLAPSRSALRHELATDRWEEVGPGLFRSRSAPRSDHQTIMTALLRAGPGSVVSHHSAAALWELPGFLLCPPHITCLRVGNTRPLDWGVLHSARSLNADQITTLEQLPVTRPERVPFDLANVGVRAERVERVVDRLWSDRLVSDRSLRRVKRSLPLRGFRGTALMREIIDERGPGWVPPASGLEGRVMQLLVSNGFNGFERQVDVGDDEWVGRVDFVNRKRKIVIEVQSDRHHAALSDRRNDQARFDRLHAAGFIVHPVWEDEIWHRPAAFLARLTHGS